MKIFKISDCFKYFGDKNLAFGNTNNVCDFSAILRFLEFFFWGGGRGNLKFFSARHSIRQLRATCIRRVPMTVARDSTSQGRATVGVPTPVVWVGDGVG